MDLAMAHIERNHRDSAALEEAVGEPACRRAGVEPAQTGRVDVEGVQCSVELLPAAADEAGWRTGEHDGVTGRHLVGGLRCDRAIDEHAVSSNRRDRIRAALDDAAPNQFGIEASPATCHDPTTLRGDRATTSGGWC
jgi:hypothetical protein